MLDATSRRGEKVFVHSQAGEDSLKKKLLQIRSCRALLKLAQSFLKHLLNTAFSSQSVLTTLICMLAFHGTNAYYYGVISMKNCCG